MWFYVLPPPWITLVSSTPVLWYLLTGKSLLSPGQMMVIVSEWTWIFRFIHLHYHIIFAQECQNIVRFNRNMFSCFSSPSANIGWAATLHKTRCWRIHHLAREKVGKWDTWIILPLEFNKKKNFLSPDGTTVYSEHILSVQLLPGYLCQSVTPTPQFLPHFHNPTSGDICFDQAVWAITLSAMPRTYTPLP